MVATVKLDLQNLAPLRVRLDGGFRVEEEGRTHSVVVVGTDNKTFLAYCLSGGDIYRDNIAGLAANDEYRAKRVTLNRSNIHTTTSLV